MNGALPNWRGGGGWKYSGTSAGKCARSNPKTPVQNFVSETEQNRTGRRSKTGFLRVEIEVDGIERVKMTLGHRPQDTALPEGNRSGGRCQRGLCLGVAAWSISCRDTSKRDQAHWPKALNSGGLGAGPHGRDCNWSVGCLKLLECKEATHPPPSS